MSLYKGHFTLIKCKKQDKIYIVTLMSDAYTKQVN